MIIRWRSSYVATAQSRLVVTRFQKLEKHLNTHDRKQFVCTFKNCTVDKSTKGELWQHIRDHHQKRKYECSECPMSYDILSRLKAHCVGSHTVLKIRRFFGAKYKNVPCSKQQRLFCTSTWEKSIQWKNIHVICVPCLMTNHIDWKGTNNLTWGNELSRRW